MYTQCPECNEAFRVTADVLKQAAGKVRCGGCGDAFNALEHLSEQMPASAVRHDADTQLPELTPESTDGDTGDTRPHAISAEESAALLKTLDQLAAGSDIRIEDTGVEWRVLDADDDDSPETEADATNTPAVMRFDDNTPLPDDFDLDAEPSEILEPQPVVAEAPVSDDDSSSTQADLAFGDPDEWEDLLGEVGEPRADETETNEPKIDAPVIDAPEIDRWSDLAAEAEENNARVEESKPGSDLVALSEAVAASTAEEPLDMDTQFAIQAEAMGIDLSGIHESADEEQTEPEDGDQDASETSIEEDLIAAAFETEAAEKRREDDAVKEAVEDIEAQVDEEIEAIEAELHDKIKEEIEDIEADLDDKVAEEIEAIDAELDDEAEEEIEAIEAELDDEIEDVGIAAAGSVESEFDIPEMTEEEKTINLMIDQDLLSMAVEDEDGFASTIVQRQPDKKVNGEIEDNKEEQEAKPLFETIIMEGEGIHSAPDRHKLATTKAAQSRRIDDPDSSWKPKLPVSGAVRGGRRKSDPASFGMIGGTIALVLLLVGQFAHQSREALATMPAFHLAVGPVYRLLGKPLTPAWDISGWRFEATKGSTDDDDEMLTIYSRVGNTSNKSLPYPLVHVSLTDRFEEIIGSRVLEPGEYLDSDADPRKAVAPGNTFNAVIAIESPAPEATGFKLDVCYRLASGQLSCAIEDFK